jgi:hypothetical protein
MRSSRPIGFCNTYFDSFTGLTDVTEAAGIDNPRWGASVGLVDFDRDGWLDLYVGTFRQRDAKPNLFFRNVRGLLRNAFPVIRKTLGDDALSAARQAVERVLRAHEPYPALAFDRRWNILMTNRALDPFLAEVAPDLLRPPVNLVRLGLHPRGLAPLVVNLADVRAVFRSRIARQLDVAPDPELAALYEELLAPGPGDAPRRPSGAHVVIPMIIRFDGRELRLFSTITTFGTPMDITLDEVAIESYYPENAQSAAYFTKSDD